MTCVAEIHAFHARLADRWGWRIVPAALVFWTILWPLGLPVLAAWLVRRHLALDNSHAAKTQRRVARLLRWYPADWRARYQATRYWHDHPEEGAEIVARYKKVPSALAKRIQFGEPRAEIAHRDVQRLIELADEYGLIPRTIAARDVLAR